MTIPVRDVSKIWYHDTVETKNHPGERMILGENMSTTAWYQWTAPFINIIKGGSQRTQGGVDSGNGYRDTTSGGSWSIIVTEGNWVKTGDWVLKWTGTCNAEWDVDGVNGATEIDIGGAGYPTVNRREYNIANNLNNFGSFVTMTGGTCTDVALIQPDDEAAYDLGQILASQFLSDLSGMQVMRFMQWCKTNDSRLRLFSEYPDFDDVIWTPTLSQKGMVQCAIDANTDIWWCVNHQSESDDATITSLADEINTLKDVGQKVYIEYSNEGWQSAGGFNDQGKWIANGDVSHADIPCVPSTATCTSVSPHGLSMGETLRLFSNYVHQKFPYCQGSAKYPIVRSTTEFVLAQDNNPITGISKADPCVITSVNHSFNLGPSSDTVEIQNVNGMTEINNVIDTVTVIDDDSFSLDNTDSTAFTDYTDGGFAFELVAPIDSTITLIRYKRQGESSVTSATNYATLASNVWALCREELGDDMIAVGAGQRANPGLSAEQMNVQAYRENLDFYTVAGYYRFIGTGLTWEVKGANAKHTGADDSAFLQDDDAGWTPGEWVGYLIVKVTGTKEGRITASTETTITAALEGGETWNTGDSYRIPIWENKTDQECADFLQFMNGPDVLADILANIDNVGSMRLVTYETGDHNSGSAKSATETSRLISYEESDPNRVFVNWWAKALNNIGCHTMIHHSSHGSWANGSVFSKMQYPGDVTSPKHEGLIPFLENDGVPGL